MDYRLWLIRRRFGRLINMTQDDPVLAQIVAQFKRFDVETSRGAYVIVDRRTSDPIARLRPIPNTDRFESFYLVKYRWPLAYVWQLWANEAHA